MSLPDIYYVTVWHKEVLSELRMKQASLFTQPSLFTEMSNSKVNQTHESPPALYVKLDRAGLISGASVDYSRSLKLLHYLVSYKMRRCPQSLKMSSRARYVLFAFKVQWTLDRLDNTDRTVDTLDNFPHINPLLGLWWSSH